MSIDRKPSDLDDTLPPVPDDGFTTAAARPGRVDASKDNFVDFTPDALVEPTNERNKEVFAGTVVDYTDETTVRVVLENGYVVLVKAEDRDTDHRYEPAQRVTVSKIRIDSGENVYAFSTLPKRQVIKAAVYENVQSATYRPDGRAIPIAKTSTTPGNAGDTTFASIAPDTIVVSEDGIYTFEVNATFDVLAKPGGGTIRVGHYCNSIPSWGGLSGTVRVTTDPRSRTGKLMFDSHVFKLTRISSLSKTITQCQDRELRQGANYGDISDVRVEWSDECVTDTVLVGYTFPQDQHKAAFFSKNISVDAVRVKNEWIYFGSGTGGSTQNQPLKALTITTGVVFDFARTTRNVKKFVVAEASLSGSYVYAITPGVTYAVTFQDNNTNDWVLDFVDGLLRRVTKNGVDQKQSYASEAAGNYNPSNHPDIVPSFCNW